MSKIAFFEGYTTGLSKMSGEIDPEYKKKLLQGQMEHDRSVRTSDVISPVLFNIPAAVAGHDEGGKAINAGFTPEEVGHPGWRRFGSAVGYGALGGIPGQVIGRTAASKGSLRGALVGNAVGIAGSIGGGLYGSWNARQNFKERLKKAIRERKEGARGL